MHLLFYLLSLPNSFSTSPSRALLAADAHELNSQWLLSHLFQCHPLNMPDVKVGGITGDVARRL